MRIVQYREIPEDPKLHRQWNDVAQNMERPEVFYTCEWALAVQNAYRGSLKPLLFLGYEEENLVGVASLVTNATDAKIVFLAATTADYCDFLTQPSCRAEFLDAVFSELGKMQFTSLILANLPEDSATSAALPVAAKKHGFHIHVRPAYLCAQVELGVGNKRKELKAMLAGKKKLRQYLRGMEREGPVTFAHLQSPTEIQAALPAFADAHVARFQATGRVSSLSTPERRFFLQELVRQFEDTGVVTLSMLMVGDRPVAWNYGFQFQRSWFWYQPTFDGSQELNSPGYCLLSRIVIEACDIEGMQTVDLGLGAEGYKERFGNHTRQTLYITMTRSWPRHLAEAARYQAAKVLKKFPRLESAIRRVLGR